MGDSLVGDSLVGDSLVGDSLSNLRESRGRLSVPQPFALVSGNPVGLTGDTSCANEALDRSHHWSSAASGAEALLTAQASMCSSWASRRFIGPRCPRADPALRDGRWRHRREFAHEPEGSCEPGGQRWIGHEVLGSRISRARRPLSYFWPIMRDSTSRRGHAAIGPSGRGRYGGAMTPRARQTPVAASGRSDGVLDLNA